MAESIIELDRELYNLLTLQSIYEDLPAPASGTILHEDPKFVQNAGEQSLDWFNRYLGRKRVTVLNEAAK